METVRHIALGCCVLSTVAGVVRIFWPDNSFAPVINAVLVLYIVTAGFQMVRGADWRGLREQLYLLPDSAQMQTIDYTRYSQELGISASVEAVHEVLTQAGVEAVVTQEGEACRVELVHAEDRARAESVLAASCGSLSYELVSGGSTP